jgi:hypothetical protein
MENTAAIYCRTFYTVQSFEGLPDTISHVCCEKDCATGANWLLPQETKNLYSLQFLFGITPVDW